MLGAILLIPLTLVFISSTLPALSGTAHYFEQLTPDSSAAPPLVPLQTFISLLSRSYLHISVVNKQYSLFSEQSQPLQGFFILEAKQIELRKRNVRFESKQINKLNSTNKENKGNLFGLITSKRKNSTVRKYKRNISELLTDL